MVFINAQVDEYVEFKHEGDEGASAEVSVVEGVTLLSRPPDRIIMRFRTGRAGAKDFATQLLNQIALQEAAEKREKFRAMNGPGMFAGEDQLREEIL